MTEESVSARRARSSVDSNKTRRVVSYRVAVKKIAKAILQIRATGDIPEYMAHDLEEISCGA